MNYCEGIKFKLGLIIGVIVCISLQFFERFSLSSNVFEQNSKTFNAKFEKEVKTLGNHQANLFATFTLSNTSFCARVLKFYRGESLKLGFYESPLAFDTFEMQHLRI